MQLCEAFEPPQPLLEYQQAPLPYPVEALGELLGPTVQRLAEVIGVPCAMAAQSVLATTLHGYLSSPTGGGVRHGTDLKEGIAIQPHEARLYCNLARSYLSFLLEEHDQQTSGASSKWPQ